jgi:hypothetical protein
VASGVHRRIIMNIARASWPTGIVLALAVVTLQSGAADASRRIVIKPGEGHAGLRIAIGQDRAAASPKKWAPLKWMKRQINIAKTGRRLNREYKNVFRLGPNLVVSNDQDLVAHPTSDQSPKAAGEATVVDRETGATLRPIRLLRKSRLLDLGPGHELAVNFVRGLFESQFEDGYQHKELTLERDGDRWLARFKGLGSEGVVALRVGNDGRWFISDDGTYAWNGEDSYNVDY